MSVQHSAIVLDADNHEPKGAPTATAGKVYVSDGAGSGIWTPTSIYGELYITSGATTQALTATAARLDPGTVWDSGESSGITLTPDDGTMTIVTTGKYITHVWVSFDTDSVASGTLYTFYYALDGVVSPRSFSTQKVTAGVDRITNGVFGIVSLTAGQVLSIYAKSSINSTITVREAGFSLHRV